MSNIRTSDDKPTKVERKKGYYGPERRRRKMDLVDAAKRRNTGLALPEIESDRPNPAGPFRGDYWN